LSNISAFRHDPAKSILALTPATPTDVDWLTEPAVSAYQRLIHPHPHEEADIPVPVCATPVIVLGLGVVVAGYDGRVRLLAPDLQKQYWAAKLPGPVYASLLVDAGRRGIIAADTTGTLAGLSLKGEARWTATLPGPAYATPAVIPERDLLVAACFGGICAGVDLGTGRIVFRTELPRPWFAEIASTQAFRDPYASPVVTPAGLALLCAADTVCALDAEGRVIWRRTLDNVIRASPAVVRKCSVVVISCVDGSCSFLDCATGEVLGRLMLGDKVTASLAASGARVAVGAASGAVFGLDAVSRSVAWSAPHGAPFDHSSFTVLPNGAFACTNARGNIVARAAEDGRFLWETSQLLGLTAHEPRLDITPVVAPDGSMICASYTSAVYAFAFRRHGALR
jgi:outer membrane protein assembly factor BamB